MHQPTLRHHFRGGLPRCTLTPLTLRLGRLTSGYAVRFVALAHPNRSLRERLRISARR